MTIQTEYKEGWKDTEHKNWHDVTIDGWEFAGIDPDGNAIMTRNGYINRWRNKPKNKTLIKYNSETGGFDKFILNKPTKNVPDTETEEYYIQSQYIGTLGGGK